jgi:NAD(P)-dependent dehydrogenase (short-subunit alcohol dehydrogenase family)
LVTGAGRGIGAETASALAEAGASVFLAARTKSEIDSIGAKLRAAGHKAYAAPCDVTRPASVRAMAKIAERQFGHIDILVNNAGMATSAPVKSLDLADWSRVLEVNATGTLLCTQAFLPGMLQRGWGRIINVASVAGKVGDRYIAAYAASKHAVLGLTRSLALEVAEHGVTANAVCPGYVETPMTDDSVVRIVAKTGASKEKVREAIRAKSPQHRIIGPDEVAFLIVTLCDDRAKGINGQAIVIDGGGVQA